MFGNVWTIVIYLILLNLTYLGTKTSLNPIDRPLMYSSNFFNFIFFTIPTIAVVIMSIFLLIDNWKYIIILILLNTLLLGPLIFIPLLERLLALIYLGFQNLVEKKLEKK